MKFAVLNPGGRDTSRLFPDGASHPDHPGHPPVNYHAYAACMNGGFFDAEKQIPETVQAVLVLLRRDLKRSLRAIEHLKKKNVSCFISWKESGAHQVAALLSQPKRLRLFLEICRMSDGFISTTAPLEFVYRSAGCVKGAFIPTPYPLSHPDWNFSHPAKERAGIFIGTREFDVPSRNHLAAILGACSLGERLNVSVTCVTESGSGADILKVLSKRFSSLRIQKGRLPYPKYLALMAAHQLVFQWDSSEVPGQVAGDAALCRIPCVGGNSAIEQLVFPSFCGSRNETLHLAEKLLTDADFYHQSCGRSIIDAQTNISYEAVQKALERFLFAGD